MLGCAHLCCCSARFVADISRQAYMLYSAEVREETKAELPEGAKVTDVAKAIARHDSLQIDDERSAFHSYELNSYRASDSTICVHFLTGRQVEGARRGGQGAVDHQGRGGEGALRRREGRLRRERRRGRVGGVGRGHRRGRRGREEEGRQGQGQDQEGPRRPQARALGPFRAVNTHAGCIVDWR